MMRAVRVERRDEDEREEVRPGRPKRRGAGKGGGVVRLGEVFSLKREKAVLELLLISVFTKKYNHS